MSSPEHREVAELMLAKARADASAARLLATHEDQDDGIIGFHAQQACEKALEAVLAIAAADIPLSHNLGFCTSSLALPSTTCPTPSRTWRG